MAGRAVADFGKLLARRAVQRPALRQTLRGGGELGPKADPKYGSYHPPVVDSVHKNLAKGMGTACWFWIFYRAYYDLPTLLGAHPFLDEHH
mmetsp:Transcript_34664/g.88735  ORF Transcript_34664/g.88735 Transcript_34664/m.88735 type:complete len:91 (+) Transcript_34664:24-296(+)